MTKQSLAASVAQGAFVAQTCVFLADLCVFIGRFQPFHEGHLKVIREALQKARYVMIGVGSAGDPRRPDYIPWTAEERINRMILPSLTEEERARVICIPIEDSAYNLNDWITRVQAAANEALAYFGVDQRDARVSLIGHSKDNSSFYLKLFPQWDSIEVENFQGLSATPFRLQYFDSNSERVQTALEAPADTIPQPVREFLFDFQFTDTYRDLVEEWTYVKNYRAAWAKAPYPPMFVTTDACVVKGGHILLVRRKNRPGMGLWALPGGFLNQDERIIDGIIRELKEETKIDVPERVLRSSIIETRVFDHPHRSSRGRVITHAALIHLTSDVTPDVSASKLQKTIGLPWVTGADDAEKAKWWPIANITRAMMFEDHYSMIQNLISLL